MALGLLLWVSWICFLLFDGSAGLPAIKGYGYPSKDDSRNIGDDGDDEGWLSGLSDWQASNNQPSFPVHTSYSNPSALPSHQNLPNKPSVPEVDRLVNGAARDWGLENPKEPIVFPLGQNYLPSFSAQPQPGPVQPQPGPVQPQPGPVQPQSTSLGVASVNSMPAAPAGGSSLYASPASNYKPAPSTSQAAMSPNVESWAPQPVDRGYGVSANQGFTSNSNNAPHRVYEEVFHYPSDNTGSSSSGGSSQANYIGKESASKLARPSFPRFPTNVGPQPVFPPGLGLKFGKTAFWPHKIFQQPKKPVVNTQKVLVTQRVSEPVLPPLPPSSYIVQSRNGYQRTGNLISHSKYTPEFAPPMPVSSKGVKGQPAAPKGVKNPQRMKHH
ncbi:protein transport protein Sec31A-like [Plectropomus leopardus]|uniref:protein transport protein Sec31A-like n=1 Tax=Plectropomus leopardus TaxID=160734 RepID=UPI001C4B241F|nr:protein transport protein Sec31A-like [Plectropomus leopardus]XP_042361090.1 protein transport protein Sec31A-like [Plectropomus leopardus]